MIPNRNIDLKATLRIVNVTWAFSARAQFLYRGQKFLD
jgi:hypothetical protein